MNHTKLISMGIHMGKKKYYNLVENDPIFSKSASSDLHTLSNTSTDDEVIGLKCVPMDTSSPAPTQLPAQVEPSTDPQTSRSLSKNKNSKLHPFNIPSYLCTLFCHLNYAFITMFKHLNFLFIYEISFLSVRCSHLITCISNKPEQ